MKRVAIDIGGTFTDLVAWDDEQHLATVYKLPSTPQDPSIAGTAGLEALCDKAGIEPRQIDSLVHGTTVATNILLERNGAKVGLVTTDGFRDILHIGRKNRPLNFSHTQELARQSQPLARRHLRRTVRERITGADGRVEVPLNEADVRVAAQAFRDEAKYGGPVDAVAVCCLFSFANPRHEQRIVEILSEELPGVFVCASHEVVPLYREYERFSTTVVNAYVGPRTAKAIDLFASRLRKIGLTVDLKLMTSAGGLTGSESAKRRPVSLLLSGPVGALLAGIEVGRRCGAPNIITLDVGGTSADIGVAPRGELRRRSLLDTKIGVDDVMLPMIDIDTIGAGGGSIATVDTGGMFRVGPESAGAEPGPACFGRGGEQPTVTDAVLTLGWYRPEGLADSGMSLDPGLARAAIEHHLSEPLELTVERAAAGVVAILVNNMVEAIRVNSVAKGYDPREFALVAYGGAGATFAVDVARQLEIPRVVVPRHPGVGAAAGLLVGDLKVEKQTTLWTALESGESLQQLHDAYHELAAIVSAELSADTDGDLDLRYWAECRYVGQGYELMIDVPAPPAHSGGDEDRRWLETVRGRFDDAHEAIFKRHFPDKPKMIVNAGCEATASVPPLQYPSLPPAVAPSTLPRDAVLERRPVTFLSAVSMGEISTVETPFIDRATLRTGQLIDGPAVIEQVDSTTLLPPESRAEVDTQGNLVIRTAKRAHSSGDAA